MSDLSLKFIADILAKRPPFQTQHNMLLLQPALGSHVFFHYSEYLLCSAGHSNADGKGFYYILELYLHHSLAITD